MEEGDSFLVMCFKKGRRRNPNQRLETKEAPQENSASSQTPTLSHSLSLNQGHTGILPRFSLRNLKQEWYYSKAETDSSRLSGVAWKCMSVGMQPIPASKNIYCYLLFFSLCEIKTQKQNVVVRKSTLSFTVLGAHGSHKACAGHHHTQRGARSKWGFFSPGRPAAAQCQAGSNEMANMTVKAGWDCGERKMVLSVLRSASLSNAQLSIHREHLFPFCIYLSN